MHSTVTLSLAILKVNMDRTPSKDYIDTYVPFLAECVRRSGDDVLSQSRLQAQMLNEFGLRIPQGAIVTIMRRAVKQGYLHQEKMRSTVSDGPTTRFLFRPNHDALDKLDFHNVQHHTLEQHQSLIARLIDFVGERGQTWTLDDAEKSLHAYFEENPVHIFSRYRANSSAVMPPVDTAVPHGGKYLVGIFIQHLAETDDPAFAYAEAILQGHMLANVLFLPNSSTTRQEFEHTAVYFDTEFLMYALGYQGLAFRDPAVELLNLVSEARGQMRCLPQTVEEIRRNLYTAGDVLERQDLSDLYGSLLQTVLDFQDRGIGRSDIDIMVDTIEEELLLLGIEVLDSSFIEKEYWSGQIDEPGFEQALSSWLTYKRVKAREHDVTAVATIMRLRKGESYAKLETCKAVLVTTNMKVILAARRFFYPETRPNSIAPCVSDIDLATVLWLKEPMSAPNLPRKRIIAMSYAATRPSDAVLGAYLSKLTELEHQNGDAEAQYRLLRYSTFARTALMEVTLGDGESITQGNMAEIHARIKAHEQAEVLTRLNEEMRTNEQFQTQAKVRETRRASKSLEYAQKAIFFVRVIAILFLVVGMIMLFPGVTPPQGAVDWIRLTVLAVMLFASIVSFLSLVNGFNLQAYTRKLEGRLAKLISTWLGQFE